MEFKLEYLIEAVKALKSMSNYTLGKNPKRELNCISIELRDSKIEWCVTDTRILIYGSADYQSNQNLDLMLDINSLYKLKKPSKFEFFEGGLRVDTSEGEKTLKTLPYGKYPDYRKLLPEKLESTLECDFSELGTLLKALGCDVRLKVVDGELEFFQSEYNCNKYDYQFSMKLPFKGSLYETFRLNHKIISFLSKQKIKILHCDEREGEIRVSFDYGVNKVLAMTYRV